MKRLIGNLIAAVAAVFIVAGVIALYYLPSTIRLATEPEDIVAMVLFLVVTLGIAVPGVIMAIRFIEHSTPATWIALAGPPLAAGGATLALCINADPVSHVSWPIPVVFAIIVVLGEVFGARRRRGLSNLA